MALQDPPGTHYPGKDYLLRHAAADGQLIVCRCNACKRMVRYLAADLAQVLGPDRYAAKPPFACSVCGKTDYVSVKFASPSPGDYGHLTVRRPGPVRHVQTWRTVKLGDG